MLKLPIGLQDFESLREEGFLYVDKTKDIYKLLEGKVFFLSRPRRFGKSLLVNTLKELFRGKKHLFKGLWIEDKIEWRKHPVISLDFSAMDYHNLGLEAELQRVLKKSAKSYQISLEEKSSKTLFEELIEKLAQKGETEGKVVIVVDEYDKPIIDYLGETQIETAKKHQAILKNFYGVLKAMDKHLRFVFLTGVSKFSRTSIFSELNHLEDLTMNELSSSLVGYTQNELETNFGDKITQIAQKKGMTEADLMAQIRLWYNGYSWHGTKIYNPFSILNFMRSGSFDNYWFNTGSPTFLIKTLRKDLTYNFDRIEAVKSLMETFRIDNLHPVTLLFQTGYLTIKNQEGRTYILGFPNLEVKQSLLEHLLYDYTQRIEGDLITQKIVQSFHNQDFEELRHQLNILISKIPYPIFEQNLESYYHAVFFMIFQMVGFYIECEVNTSRGRIDAVIKTTSTIFIIEFKVEKSAKDALQQIRERKYFERYLDAPQDIQLVGIRCYDKTFQAIQVEKL